MTAHHSTTGAACSKRPQDPLPGPGFVFLVESAEFHKFCVASAEEGVLTVLQDLRHRLPFPVKLLHVIKADDPLTLARALYEMYRWGDQGDGWLVLRNLDVMFIKTLAGGAS